MLTSIHFSFVLVSIFYQSLAYAQQIPLLSPQSDTWNSSLTATSLNLTGTGITSPNQAANLALALNFERSNWAFSSIALDDFYTNIPSNASTLPPGSIVKVQTFTNTTTYTLPPNVALSRIVYTTQNLQNETVPTSVFVLWPFLPFSSVEYSGLSNPVDGVNSSKFPVVGWAHGTSGIFGECGPSHIRNLWYQYSAPFTAAWRGTLLLVLTFKVSMFFIRACLVISCLFLDGTYQRKLRQQP